MNEMSTKTVIITDKNEILFWKVFKNIYLLKTILDKVSTEEWVEYNDHKQIHSNNRIKFKHIISLEWMIDYKQYELLLYKIKSTDEYIEINKNGIEKLFNMGNSKKETKIEKFKEIFSMLMKYRKLEMNSSVSSLIYESIQLNSTLSLKLLLDDQYENYQVLPFSLELILSTQNIDALKLVMEYHANNDNGKDKVIICEETKLKSLYLATQIQNTVHSDKFIELILNNYPELYTIHPIQPTESQLQHIQKVDSTSFLCITCSMIQFKLIQLNCIESKISASTYEHSFNLLLEREIKEPSLLLFKSIKKILIYFQTLQLDSNDGDSDAYEIIQLKVNNILSNQSMDELNKLKELHKLLILNFKSTTIFYEGYLMIYDEIIKETNDYQQHFKISIKYCIGSTSSNLLKSLLSSSNNLEDPRELCEWKHCRLYLYNLLVPSFTPSSLSEFIKIYTEIGYIKLTDSEYIENIIIHKIFSIITSNQDYQQIIKSISNSFKPLLDRLPNQWNSVLSNLINVKQSIPIKDNETIDWLLKYVSKENGNLLIHNGNIISNQKLITWPLFKFENFKTLKYYYINNEVNYETTQKYKNHIRDLYIKSILECNIKELEYFKNNFNDNSLSIDSFKDPLNLNSLSKEQIIKVLNHCSFNENGQLFYFIIPSVLDKFKNDLSSIGSGCSGGGGGINFNSNVNGTIKLLVKCILEYKLKYVIFILDNFNHLSNLSVIENEFKNNYSFNNLYNSDGDICTLNIKSNKIYKMVQFLVNLKLKIHGSDVSDGSNGGSNDDNGNNENDNYSCILVIESIIQNLYNRFIQIKGITIDQLFKLRKLIQQTMEIEHSLYHSFHYINIKSKKLIKYIMNRPYLIQFLQDRGMDFYYDNKTDIDEEWELQSDINSNFNISNYLNYKEFTFQYLFGNGSDNGGEGGASFDEILLKLIDQLSHNPLDELLPKESNLDDEESIRLRNGYLTIKLNADLEYCLDIKRIDLFFKQLEFIKSLIEQGITVGSFPKVFKEVYHKALHAHKNIKHKVISSQFVEEHPTHFEFTNQVINKITMVLQVDSLLKLTGYKIFGLFFFNSLFEVYITQNPIKIDCIDYLFKFCGAPFIASWERLIQSNVLFLIDHFINNFKNDDLLQVNFKQGKKVLFNYGLLKIKFAKLSEHYCAELESAFKFSQNQQVFYNFKQPELQKQVLFDILQSKVLDTEFSGELINQDDQDQVSMYFSDHSNEIKELINKFSSNAMGIIDENDINDINDEDCINDTIFTRSFKSGFIKLSCLLYSKSTSRILNPNGKKEIFKITNQTITDTIFNNNINIIKYYYENTDLITGNNQLLHHLKNELSLHLNYKYLNLFKNIK